MIKKIISLTVLTAMLISINITAVSANSNNQEAEVDYKVETVYGMLQPTGIVNDIYIVNEFNVTKLGILSDFGEYSAVKNLTNIEKISNENSQVNAYSDEGKFYYQGDLKSKELPWNFDIEYTLDDKIIDTSKLAGSSGNLEISINTEKNDDISGDYYEKYMLQITVTLDSGNTDNIIINNGTLNSVGGYKIITFTGMPNQDLKCSLKVDVKDFEMVGITINAVPLSFGLDMLDMDEFESGLTELALGVSKLNQGASELSRGSTDINGGINGLANGSKEFNNGIGDLDASGEAIGAGSKQIKAALDTLNLQLQGMNNDELIVGLNGIKDSLTKLSTSLENIRMGMEQANLSMDVAVNAMPVVHVDTENPEELGSLTETLNDTAAGKVGELYDYYLAGENVKTTWYSLSPIYEDVVNSIPDINDGIDSMVLGIEQMISGINNSGLDQLVAGVNQLAIQYGNFDDGLSLYLDGIGDSATGYAELNNGITGLNSQYIEFDNGVKDLADGISELNNSTGNLPNEIDEMMAEYDNTNYKPISYASKDNEEIESLQFLLVTDSIEIVKEEQVIEPEEELNFWQRFIRLFIGD